MKQGQTLNELAQALTFAKEQAKDYIAPPTQLAMVPQGEAVPLMRLNGIGEYRMRPVAHQQLAEYTKIPKPYYDRMLTDAPHLLATNVNTWLQGGGDDKRMVRTIGSDMRALLSDRYRPLDNYDLAMATLPTLELKQARVVSSALTETKLYLKAVAPRVRIEVKVGDVVEAGVVISNSEVGLGSLSVSPFLNRLVCANGMIVNKLSNRKAHLGRRSEAVSDVPEEWLRDETRHAQDRAYFLQLQDLVAGFFEMAKFEEITASLIASTKRAIDAAPDKIVEAVQRRLALTEAERGNVLSFLAAGGDLSQYGLAQAVTATAEKAANYDRATELEAAGGQIINLGDSEWQVLTREAA